MHISEGAHQLNVDPSMCQKNKSLNFGALLVKS